MTTALAIRPPSAVELLGTDVSNSGTAHQALVDAGIAGLDVVKVAIQTVDHQETVRGQYALESHGKPLHGITVGDDYNVVQFEANAETLDAVARRLGATFANAGALSLSQAFVSLVLPEPLEIGDDKLIATINAFMSHGTGSNVFVPGGCRILCANQQPQLVRDGRDYKVTIRHTVSAPERTALAEEAMMATTAGMKLIVKEGLEMLRQPCSRGDFTEIIDIVFPLGGESKTAQTYYDKRVAILESIFNGPTNANIADTAWCAYQSITEYVQWAKGVRGVPDNELGELSVARARRALTSGDARKDQVRAYTVIREMFGLAG